MHFPVSAALLLVLNLQIMVRDVDSSFQDHASTNSTSVWPPNLIREENYPAETHYITTEDRYILTVFRIPGSTGSKPVLIQHGLLESSADFLLPGKGRSLAYILSDYGYDVWLSNARGNTYSKKHETLSTSDPKFWDFSWDELGMYDLPAVVKYITDLKRERLFYIGHSMGATSFSVMAIERPEVAKRVTAMIGLAPATYEYHIRSLKWIGPFWKTIQQKLNAFGIYEFLPRSMFFDDFARQTCNNTALLKASRNLLCSLPFFLFAGYNPAKMDYSLLPKIWSSFPAGTSVKLFTHWLQQIDVNDVRKFDYGLETNLKVYNSTQPPTYDLSKIQVPVAVFYSPNDWIVGEEDVKKFYSQLPLKLGLFKIDDERYNHSDFLWAVDAPKLVYSKIINILAKYGKSIE